MEYREKTEGSAPNKLNATLTKRVKSFEPANFRLCNLKPDTAYEYRVVYRGAVGDEKRGEPGFFHTQRRPGSIYVFAIQADSHLRNKLLNERTDLIELYRCCLDHMKSDNIDFLFSLGDFAMTEMLNRGNIVKNAKEAEECYLQQRRFITELCRNAPFFLVPGNHEAEAGWYRNGTRESPAALGASARMKIFPGPAPDTFYSGLSESYSDCGPRQVPYAFTWGDALFVTLDPFWHTQKKPYQFGIMKKTGDRWDWTLGKKQYDWLYQTLSESKARFKFVLSHQITGGVDEYGRGGIEAAAHKVAGFASYEWNGEDEKGDYVFEEKRPNWKHGPIHKIFKDTGVDIFFHGHDHIYAYQELDGIVYQACPQPAAANPLGHSEPGRYKNGIIRENSGYIKVTVNPSGALVQYSKINENGNAVIAHSYRIDKE